MSQILTTTQKRARTKKRKEVDDEIERIDYLLKNYSWYSDERERAEKILSKLKQEREALASDIEIQEMNI